MTTRLSDIISVNTFRDLPSVNSLQKTAFFTSGIVTRSPLLDQLADAPGRTATLPFWRDLTQNEVNYSTDNPATIATVDAVTQGEQLARKAFVNRAWGATDLASELAMGPKAMARIRDRVSTYFSRQWQARVIATARSLHALNVASQSSDMSVVIAAESTGAQSASTRFNRMAFNAAVHTMGDAFDGLGAIVVHSRIHQQMVDNNDIEFIRDSEGKLVMETYLGLRVIVDDSLAPVAGTTSGFKYLSVIFGAGALGYGEGTPETPVAVERSELAGNGGGTEVLIERHTWLTHPFGYSMQGSPAGVSFTLAEMAAANRFTRVVDRKNVPIAFMMTN